MAIVTNQAHVANAIRLLKEREDMYLAIGKGITPWSNENNPPAEDASTTDISELIGMKKCETVSLARKVLQGEEPTGQVVDYEGERWLLVNEQDAYTENAHYLYIKATLRGAELPVGTYRQVGIYTGVEVKDGVTTTAVLPSELDSNGVLQFYANRSPMTRTNDILTIESWLVKL